MKKKNEKHELQAEKHVSLLHRKDVYLVNQFFPSVIFHFEFFEIAFLRRGSICHYSKPLVDAFSQRPPRQIETEMQNGSENICIKKRCINYRTEVQI